MKKIEIIFQFIENQRITNQEFEKKAGLSNGYLRNIEKTNSEPSGKMIEKMIKAYPKLEDHLENSKLTGDELRRRKAFGGRKDEGLIYVPIPAQAGYTKHYLDPLFIDHLKRMYIPDMPYKGDNYRVFEVADDSMLPTLKPHYQVIAEFIEPEFWQYAPDYYIHVIVTEDRIMVKRIFHLTEETLVLISDNETLVPQFELPVAEIKELWRVERKIDWEMPPPKMFEIKVKKE